MNQLGIFFVLIYENYYRQLYKILQELLIGDKLKKIYVKYHQIVCVKISRQNDDIIFW